MALPNLVLAMLTVGCIRPDIRTIQLLQAIPLTLGREPGAETTGVRVQAQDQRPSWERGEGKTVGNDTNPFGESIYPTFVSDRPVAAVFKEAVEAALAAQGFREGSERDWILTLTLLHFHGEIRHPLIGRDRVEAALEMTVLLQDATGRAHFTGPVKAQIVRKPIDGTTHTVQAALDQAIEAGVAALTGDSEFRTALRTGSSGPPPGSLQPSLGQPLH
jgi:uncharacterized lipoprotein YajG